MPATDVITPFRPRGRRTACDLRYLPLLYILLFFTCEAQRPEQRTPINTHVPTLFEDATRSAGLDFIHNPGADSSYFMPESIGSGAALFDYDNDGDLDIYLINAGPHDHYGRTTGRETNRLFRQEAGGTFIDVTGTSGLEDTGYGMGVAVGDIDNDGDLDVYVSNYGPDALYRNNGDGTLTNITRQAGIRNAEWGCSVLMFDYNRDGFLDIYVTNYVKFDPKSYCMDNAGRRDYCGPAGFAGVSDVLYRNNGNGTFRDVSLTVGIARKALRGLGVISADFNDDGWPDVYVANDGDPNNLWINQQDETFVDQALEYGVAFNEMGMAEAGMGIALGDIDGDGDFDLFISHLRHESNTLYRFDRQTRFRDDSTPAGLAGPSLPYTGFGTGFFDFDHDGDLDLAVANGRVTRGPLLTASRPAAYWDHYAEPNLLFENNGRGFFTPAGKDDLFCRTVENSRGLAFGDIDNDGDIDLLVNNEGGPARLYRNIAPKRGHWLGIRALDPALRRDAIGARVEVVTATGRYVRQIMTGYGFLTSHDPRAHFGLGAATAVDSVIVHWPDGSREAFTGLPVDSYVTLVKGSGAPL